MRWRNGAVPLVLTLVLAVVGAVADPAVAGGGVPAGAISGRVTVPAGVDPTGVQVSVYNVDVHALSGGTRPAPDGSYVVDGLVPGRYNVEYVGWDVGLIHEFWNDDHLTPDVVVVGSDLVTGINATLTLGATVTGTIHTNSDCDLTGVYVRLYFAPAGTYADAVVDVEGRWSLRSIPTGSYGLQFDGRYVGLPQALWSGGGWGSKDGISLIPLTAGQTRTGIDITLDGPQHGCTALRPYVATVYRDLLRRDPDWPGLNDWMNRLVWGASFGSVANGITASDEYRGRMIGDTYQGYLGRGAEPTGLASWLGRMRAGWQIEDIQAGFVASDEFYARYGSTPAGWVTGLYRTVLGRDAAGDEVQWWVSRLGRGASRMEVARGFLYSTEHLTAVVDGYYVDLLGRHIDPTGRATWVGLLQRGHRDEEIVAGIVASEEYRGMVPRTYIPSPPPFVPTA